MRAFVCKLGSLGNCDTDLVRKSVQKIAAHSECVLVAGNGYELSFSTTTKNFLDRLISILYFSLVFI
jgi:hypothetical protein